MNKATRRVASPHVVSIEDLRPLAQRKLPRVVFDYLDGGAEGEVTLRENCRAFQEVTFRPRHAVALPHCDLSTRVLGFDFALPAQLAPVGYSRLMDPGGEVAARSGGRGPAARPGAARRAGPADQPGPHPPEAGRGREGTSGAAVRGGEVARVGPAGRGRRPPGGDPPRGGESADR